MKENQDCMVLFSQRLKKLLKAFEILIIVLFLGGTNVLWGTEPQQLTVSGTVTDVSSGLPMPGVNIVFKGTTIGALTDAEGKYSLIAPDRNAVLMFSFIGYITEEVPVAGKT